MKYSQLIGIICCLLLAGVCFLPWVVIESKQIVFTGWNTGNSRFGKPAVLTTVFCAIMVLCFALPFVWSKRLNLFIAALNVAWALRNYIIITACSMGECPVKKTGIYAQLILPMVILICSFLPKINVNKKAHQQND